jgi:cobalt-zinc-cadmium efflux system outer membrane protein
MEILKSGVIEQSEKNLTVIREAYRLGQLRLFDVLNEQRKLIETELAFVDAQAEAAQALVVLEKAVGGTLP